MLDPDILEQVNLDDINKFYGKLMFGKVNAEDGIDKKSNNHRHPSPHRQFRWLRQERSPLGLRSCTPHLVPVTASST